MADSSFLAYECKAKPFILKISPRQVSLTNTDGKLKPIKIGAKMDWPYGAG